MAVSIRVQPVNKEVIAGLFSEFAGAQSTAFAEFARQSIEEAKAQNQSILGRVPPYQIFVDGSRGAALERVRPGGVIVAEFQLIDDVLRFIGEELLKHSPSVTGHYKSSHVLFADGGVVDWNLPQVGLATEYTFINTVPYARKIERGLSPQAKTGVYQVVASMAKQKFGRIGKIEFNFRTLGGGQRNPAILVKPK